MELMVRVGVSDISRAKHFYDAITEIVGAPCTLNHPGLVAYGIGEGLLMIGRPAEGEPSIGNGVQVSFCVDDPAKAGRAYATALDLGGGCAGPPGSRGRGRNRFYGAYFRDLDGNKLSVFTRTPEI